MQVVKHKAAPLSLGQTKGEIHPPIPSARGEASLVLYMSCLTIPMFHSEILSKTRRASSKSPKIVRGMCRLGGMDTSCER